VNERVKFIADVLRGERSIKELCELYQVCRKTGYSGLIASKWLGQADLRILVGDLRRVPTQRRMQCQADSGVTVRTSHMGSS